MTEEANEFLYNRVINRNRLTLETLPVLKQYYQNLSIVDPARITAALNHIAVFLYEDHHDLTIRYMTEDWNEQYSGWNYVPIRSTHFHPRNRKTLRRRKMNF